VVISLPSLLIWFLEDLGLIDLKTLFIYRFGNPFNKAFSSSVAFKPLVLAGKHSPFKSYFTTFTFAEVSTDIQLKDKLEPELISSMGIQA